MSEERWRDVPGWDGAYQVSDRGRVRSADRVAADGRTLGGALVTLTTASNGYVYVTLGAGTMRRSVAVHRLVLTAFRGTNRRWNQVRHLNGNQQDNRLRNLRWGDQRLNERDKKTGNRKERDRGDREERKAESAETGHRFSGIEGCVSYVSPDQGGLW